MAEESTGYDKLSMIEWPDIPEGVRELANHFAKHLDSERREQQSAASSGYEDDLWRLINELLDKVIKDPRRYQLSPATIDRLTTDPNYFREVQIATRVRASSFYPLSRLLYLLSGIEEIHCFRPDLWVVESKGRRFVLSQRSCPEEFKTDEGVIKFFRENLISLLDAVGDHDLNNSSPIAETAIGALRVAVVIKPATNGPSAVQATIRVPSPASVKSLSDYVARGVMPQGAADFLAACIKAKANLLIAGGTASGKTTLMRVLAGMIPADEKVVVIEDTPELRLDQDRGDGPVDPRSGLKIIRPWVPLATPLNVVRKGFKDEGINQRDLVRLAMRLRPKRILLGEARGEEMAEICIAMTSGHEGSMSTIHANSALEAVDKAADFVAESRRYFGNADMAMKAVHRAVEVVVHLAEKEGGRRVVTGVVALGEKAGHRVEVYNYHEPEGLTVNSVSLGDLPPRLRDRFRAISYAGPT